MITIRADRVLVGKNQGVPLPEGMYVRISVQDRGVGVPREYLGKIFDPYFTTKKRGSGLGLATCYSIVSNHGGHISASSELGKGAIFEFYLPAGVPAPGKKQIEPEVGVIRGSGTILVMDDEDSVRSTIGSMLSVLGYRAVFAYDGDEAVEHYRRAHISGKTFDAVILDLTVPGGMGGKEAVEKILAVDNTARAIVSSGYSENPVLSDFRTYGFCDVITKPYDVRQMSRVLHRVLQDARPPRP